MPQLRGSLVRHRVLAAVVCAVLATTAYGCATRQPTVTSPGYAVTCCSTTIAAKPWHPGQQLRVGWIETGSPSPANGTHQAYVLTVILTGPYRSVTALKTANNRGPDQSRIVATAPEIRTSGYEVRSPVSVLTIPAEAAPGFYNLQIAVKNGPGTVSTDSVITVR
jgi:hypothetical protein